MFIRWYTDLYGSFFVGVYVLCLIEQGWIKKVPLFIPKRVIYEFGNNKIER
jgi:hypothetical protein